MIPVQRRDEIEEGLGRVRTRIERACAAAGRDPSSVALIVVTKTRPAEDITILADLGVRDVGENREPEGSRKYAECAGLALTWHFIGQLQRNKAGRVARYADYVHSLDRPDIIAALDRGAAAAQRRLQGLVQVDLSGGATGRGGAAPADVPQLCALVDEAEWLELAGLMAVAPLGEDPAAAFDRLARLRGEVMEEFPAAATLSAGMSGDLEEAVAAGATHVRVGSAVLGARRNVR